MQEEIEHTNLASVFERYGYLCPRREMEDRVLDLVCDDCGGSGVDVGSLGEPEACQVCLGSGIAIDAEIERKPVTSEVGLLNREAVAELELGGGR